MTTCNNKRCSKPLQDDFVYCPYCGKRQDAARDRKRPNGEGSVFKLPNGKYKAVVTYRTRDERGNSILRTRSKTCKLRKDAVAALEELKNAKTVQRVSYTFKQLYDAFMPTHKVSKATFNCYAAAMRYFMPIWDIPMDIINIDDLQECIDDCPKGRRTLENMKALANLIYKYGIPRHAIPENLNLAPFIKVTGELGQHRDSFTDAEIERIRKAIGTVSYAEHVYCMIYLGFRPSEFVGLTHKNYDPDRKCFVGGSKTDAGKDRTVTISPKIQKYIDAFAARSGTESFFCNESGKAFSYDRFRDSMFYGVLEQCGINNPVDKNGRHKYTPHSCRHTFATLMKKVYAPDSDKQKLIGHASAEMLRYYEDIRIDDMRKITDNI